ncbi:MAG TPA: hypothetical protein VES67_19275 [Vicinamibacterales bacterium]|nr:hypothetical protein [Vicinamibacterales bacterium]
MRGAVVVSLLVVATSAAGLIVLEGVSSSLLFARELFRSGALGDVAEARHTRHDSLLGWVNVPNAFFPDVYGPGMYVRINAQGFRANGDVPAHVPDGWTRGICSGDSFTFGYGVDNEHTWCGLLQNDGRRFETVNMGLGGYGADQSYLSYQRDAEQLGHQVHLFAFITLDFQRMASTTFMGYPKPTLDLENGKLVVRGVPVPRRPVYAPWVARFAPALRELRMTHLAGRVAYRLGLAAGGAPEVPDDAIWTIASVMFERLRDLNKSRGSTLVLVYLPTQKDYANTSVDAWRTRVKDLGARAGIAVVDLVDEFRKLPPPEMTAMFIQSSRLDYAKAAGHYTVAGNLWVARMLSARLVALPGGLPRTQP